MKQAFWFLCALIVPAFASGALFSVEAQISSPTPDPFVVQLTSSPTASFSTFASDMSANGRFVVFTSNGDVATEKTASRNNADGNREIFLADYAQRRIFQITNTKNVPNPTPSPSPTPTPSPSPTASPSPTPTPVPTPADLSLVKIQIDNAAPMISLAPLLSGGLRQYILVFSSNAPNPGNFDGTEGTLANDANSEIWIYRVPPVADVNLTLGTDLPLQDLAGGTFTQITNTAASRLPTAGAAGVSPFFADDNREPTINDTGSMIAFTSTRNLVPGVGNTDGNPEIFLYNVVSGSFIQGTNTQDAVLGVGLVFQSNPSLSADGSVISFFSSANLAGNNADSNGSGNAEVYLANVAGAGLTNIRQVTRTKVNPTTPQNVNVLSPGRRLSRDGSYIAFESLANDPKANTTDNSLFLGLFVYTVATDTFTLVAPRPAVFTDIAHFPAFTDYAPGTLTPSSLVFASALNFKPDGTFPAAAQDADGLNPQRSAQIFLTPLPAVTAGPFIRLTKTPAVVTFGGTRPVTSDTRKRMAFALAGAELGGGNADGSQELFYLLTPTITAESAATLSFNTGASNMPVATATPLPSPTPTPTPTPSPSPDVAPGLAPGELSIVRSTISLAPSSAMSTGGSDTRRSPALPIELNGVSLGVNGAAAGLYFVGDTEKQINFVMPIGLSSALGNVVVNIFDAGASTDTVVRGLVQIVPAQPDIFTSTNDAGGRAAAFNVTNPNARFTEPFNVTSDNGTGNQVPTIIELNLTGVRVTLKTELGITIGTTVLDNSQISISKSNAEMPGFDIINFTLPASLAGAGDVPIIVTFTRTGITATSRSANTAPHITIN